MNLKKLNTLTSPFLALALSLGLFACTHGAQNTVQSTPQITGTSEESVAPNINKNFVSPELNVELWTERFEGESREVFRTRHAVLAAMKLKAGMQIADIGAGSGLFVQLFGRAVGDEGSVVAVDISPKFLEFIATNAARDGYKNVKTQLGSDRSAMLETASLDVIFHSDTYHHFEFPKAMNADLLRTLRPGGELFVLEFERVPGVTPERLLKHVRAPKEVVIEEITASGFVLAEEISLEGLSENYLLRFRKSGSE